MKTFKTPGGKELPLLDLRGKDYLQVAHRIVWFREEKPTWGIQTDIISSTDKMSCVKATIKDETGRIVAMAHKHEAKFADHLEKAETGAIGRALAMCGYGTQFTDDLDEGERLADAPLERGKVFSKLPLPEELFNNAVNDVMLHAEEDIPIINAPPVNLGNTVIEVGKKYLGKTFSQVDKKDLKSFADATIKFFDEKGKSPSEQWQRFFEKVARYCAS